MAGAAQTSLTITARARDQTSGPLQAISRSVSRLPEQFSKSAAAMNAMGGAAQAMGGQTAMAVGKVSQLASLVATGGAFGIAIAAATVAVAAGVAVWETYSASTRAAESAAKSISGVFERQAESIKKATAATAEIEAKIRNFGKTASQSGADEAALAAKRYAGGLAGLQSELAAAQARDAALRREMSLVADEYNRGNTAAIIRMKSLQDEANANKVQLDGFRQAVAGHKALTEATRKQAEAAGELARIEDAAAEKKAKPKAIKKAADEDARSFLVMQAAIVAEAERSDAALQQIEDARWEKAAMLADENLMRDEQRNAAREELEREFAALAVTEAEKVAAANEEIANRAIASAQMWSSVAQQMGAAMGTSIAAMTLGTQTLEESMRSVAATAGEMVVRMAEQAIMAAAATAAANQFANSALLPGVGILVGAAAAATAFAMVKAYLGEIKGFAAGGLVTGGVAGRDSVPAMLMPGERVLTVEQERARAAGGLGGGGVVVNVSSTVPYSKAQLEKVLRPTMRAFEKSLRNRRMRTA